MNRMISPAELRLSREFLARRPPSLPRLLVWVSLALVVSAALWVSLAPMEEVIKAQGSLRPIINVSSVRNIVPGRVKSLSYRPGQAVTLGQELLCIDPVPLQAQMSDLEAQANEATERLRGVEAILTSLRRDINLVPTMQDTAWVRYQAWWVEDRRLKIQFEFDKRLWDEEQQLPESGTTSGKIRDLETQVKISDSLWQKHRLEFQQGLLAERDALALNMKRLAAQVDQVRVSLENTKIYSPLDGIIQEVSSLNVGDYIQADQGILRVVPRGKDELKVAIQVPARLAGKLSVGMTVKLRFSSFPFNEFGGALGSIQTIDPDSTQSQTQSGEAYFTVLTDVDRMELTDREGKTYPLKVGLQIDARFVLKSKSILFYLLEMLNLWA